MSPSRPRTSSGAVIMTSSTSTTSAGSGPVSGSGSVPGSVSGSGSKLDSGIGSLTSTSSEDDVLSDSSPASPPIPQG